MPRKVFVASLTDDVSLVLGTFLNTFHYDRFVQSNTEYRDARTGKFVCYHSRNVLRGVEQPYEHLRTVSALPNNRGSVVAGNGSMLPRITKDGKLSSRNAVPKSVIAAAGNPRTGNLGYFDDCRLTRWTRNQPEVYFAALPLLTAADRLYREILPKEYAIQKAEVAKVPNELLISDTCFSTMTVNKNFRTACHCDKGDLRCGTGIMATFGTFKGCEFIIPQYGLAVDYRPGDLLFADVHLAHGNAPLVSGERVTAILYCREKMHLCGETITSSQ